MDYAEAITRLTRVESVEDGAELIVEYADALADEPLALARAMEELGWLTGELLPEQAERAFKFIPGLTHPITGCEVGLHPQELILRGAKFADEGGWVPLNREKLQEARRQLGYG